MRVHPSTSTDDSTPLTGTGTGAGAGGAPRGAGATETAAATPTTPTAGRPRPSLDPWPRPADENGGYAPPVDVDVDVDADDVIYVYVVRGKRSALWLCAVSWAGSFASFVVVLSASVPSGSQLLLAANALTFATCYVFLIPPYVTRLLARLNAPRERSRPLVLAVVTYNAALAVAEFVGAALASSAVQECRQLSEQGQCGKMQGAIAVAFIVSMCMGASFLVSFVGSVVPRDITVTTYLRGLGLSAAGRFGGSGAPRRGAGGEDGFRAVPLFPAAASPPSSFSSSAGAAGKPTQRAGSAEVTHVAYDAFMGGLESGSGEEEEEEVGDDGEGDGSRPARARRGGGAKRGVSVMQII